MSKLLGSVAGKVVAGIAGAAVIALLGWAIVELKGCVRAREKAAVLSTQDAARKAADDLEAKIDIKRRKVRAKHNKKKARVVGAGTDGVVGAFNRLFGDAGVQGRGQGGPSRKGSPPAGKAKGNKGPADQAR